MNEPGAPVVQTIPVDLITVPNPRARKQRIFRGIVANIEQVGLKRPVTVTKRRRNGRDYYKLVCGQGRLEALKALGQESIPAIVIDASDKDSLVMSLVENCARRNLSPLELLRDVGGLKDRGYSEDQIAAKTGLSVDYVRGICCLLEKGEDRLIQAVEAGQLPITVAVEIATSDDSGIQQALQQAYESSQLRGRKLIAVKRLIQQRQRQGRGLHPDRSVSLTTQGMLKAYREDTEKKQALIRKAEATQDALTFITEAFRRLFADEHFVTLLRAERLDTLPGNLADRIKAVAEAAS